MGWRLKAVAQNLISQLPDWAAERAYYQLQRHLGALRLADPGPHLRRALRLLTLLREAGGDVHGATLLEVGTGRSLNVPIVLWLCGAARVITVDLYRYLRAELVVQMVRQLVRDRDRVESMVGEAGVPMRGVRERLDVLAGATTFSALQACAGISYVAPADASGLPLRARTIDVHFSTNVLEHVPPDGVAAMLAEGVRVVRAGGLMAHRVDLSDHFSHDDSSISAVHFLRFTDAEWSRIAGNRFMYHNRLRADDYRTLLADVGIRTTVRHEHVDSASLASLRAGFPTADRFAGRPPEVLAVDLVEFVGAVAN